MLFSAGLREVGKIGLDFLRARRQRREIVSFADFAESNFGKTLARRFLLNYSSKVWGLPADQLSPAVATRRLSGMTLSTLLTELFTPSKKTSHLDGRFLYPRGGYGKIVEAIEATLPSDSLLLNSEVTGFEVEAGFIKTIRTRTRSTSIPVSGTVVSTLPTTLLVRLLARHLSPEVVSCGRELRFRNIRLVFLRLGQPSFSENASIYIPDPDLCITRLYEPKNRCDSMSPSDETGIVAEIPCFEGDWISELSDGQLYRRVVEELESLGLLERNRILDWRHHYLPDAYPVYSLDFEQHLERILDALGRFRNLSITGRNGLFFYSHLHDQMRSAREFVLGLKPSKAAVSA
jgi:protoporphyrinogen oxidase